jgi:hypothetical protein
MPRRGFTLIELLVFAALFSAVMIGLVTIFIVIVRVQSRQLSANEVETQGQFLVQQIQYYVQSARLVDMPVDSVADTLKVREATLSSDPTYISQNNLNGLVAYWKLNDATGTIAHDSSGDGYNGTLTNGPTWTTGKLGGALSFNASNFNYITLGNIASFGGMSAMTISGWVKSTSTDEEHIIDKSLCEAAPNTGSWELLFGSDVHGPGIPEFVLYPPSTFATTIENDSGPVVNDGQWHLVTGTANGTDMDLYVDGVLVATQEWSLPIYAGTQAVEIGGHCNGSGYYLNGQLDDVRVYNRALNASEIQALYNQTVYLQQTNSGVLQPLTSNKVTVSNLSFTHHYNLNNSSTAYGFDSVSYSFTMAANNSNATQFYSQTFRSSVMVAAPVPKIALVQRAVTSTGSGVTALKLPFPENNVSGNLLVAVVANTTSSASVTLADTAGNHWALAASATYAAYNEKLSIFYATSSINSSNTVTASFGIAVGNPSLFLYEYRGASTSTPFDAFSSQTQTNTTAMSSGSASPTSTVELLFSVLYCNPSTGSVNAGTGFTLEASSSVSSAFVEDQDVYVTGPVSANWSYAGTSPPTTSSSVLLATFR